MFAKLKKSRATILLTLAGVVIVPTAAVQLFGYVGPIQILTGMAFGVFLGSSIAWVFGCYGAGWE